MDGMFGSKAAAVEREHFQQRPLAAAVLPGLLSVSRLISTAECFFKYDSSMAMGEMTTEAVAPRLAVHSVWFSIGRWTAVRLLHKLHKLRLKQSKISLHP